MRNEGFATVGVQSEVMGIRGGYNFEFLILNWASLRGAVGPVGQLTTMTT